MKGFLAFALVLGTLVSARADEGYTPVTDQGYTLQCWAIAITSRLDVSASRVHGGPLKLSPKYLIYVKTRAEVLQLIFNREFELYDGMLCEKCAFEPIYYEQGGILLDGVAAIKRFGAVPEEVYGGFPEYDEELFRDLNRLIGKYHALEDKLDFSSRSVRRRVDRELRSVLDKHLGRPPHRFYFEGEKFTPRSFFRTYLPEWRKAKARELHLSPDYDEGKSVEEAFDGTKYGLYTTGKPKRLRAVVSESLKAGEVVLLQYKAVDDYNTQKNGYIGFAIHGLKPVRPTRKRWNDPKLMTHYVLAIGGEWDEKTGRLMRIRVKNTWGTSEAEGFGFHWMETDYLPWLEGVEISARLEPRLRKLGLLPN